MDKTVLNEQPFNRYGNVVYLFEGKIETAKKIDELNGRIDLS